MHEHEYQSSVSSSYPSACNSEFVFPSTPAIAELICRESKKLEKQMRTQFRRRARIERSNQLLLVKQEVNRQKRTQWEGKLNSAEAKKIHRGQVLKLINNARMTVHQTLTSKVSLAVNRRKEAMLARQIESELRAEENLRVKEDNSLRHSDAWLVKYSEVRERLSQKEELEAHKAQELLAKIRQSNIEFEQRKSRNIELHRLRGEDVNLRLVDALEKKDRINLDQAQKLKEISVLMRQEDERGIAEQFTKVEIMKRRKALSELTRLTTPLIIPIESLPGPGDYIPTCNYAPQGISFGKSDQTHSSLFRVTNTDVPAPGEYNPQVLADGSRPWNQDPVVSFGTSVKTSYLDEQQKQKRSLPGPATYDLSPRQPPNTAPKIVSSFLPPSRPVETPGPGAYTIDTFTKTEKIVRAVSTADVFKNLFNMPKRPPVIGDYDLEI